MSKVLCSKGSRKGSAVRKKKLTVHSGQYTYSFLLSTFLIFSITKNTRWCGCFSCVFLPWKNKRTSRWRNLFSSLIHSIPTFLKMEFLLTRSLVVSVSSLFFFRLPLDLFSVVPATYSVSSLAKTQGSFRRGISIILFRSQLKYKGGGNQKERRYREMAFGSYLESKKSTEQRRRTLRGTEWSSHIKTDMYTGDRRAQAFSTLISFLMGKWGC